MLPQYLTSALDGGEWSASRSPCLIPIKMTLCTHWIGRWMGLRAGLNVVEWSKIFCPFTGNLSPAVEHAARRCIDWAILAMIVKYSSGNMTNLQILWLRKSDFFLNTVCLCVRIPACMVLCILRKHVTLGSAWTVGRILFFRGEKDNAHYRHEMRICWNQLYRFDGFHCCSVMIYRVKIGLIFQGYVKVICARESIRVSYLCNLSLERVDIALSLLSPIPVAGSNFGCNSTIFTVLAYFPYFGKKIKWSCWYHLTVCEAMCLPVYPPVKKMRLMR
jgi:hypothetical protein